MNDNNNYRELTKQQMLDLLKIFKNYGKKYIYGHLIIEESTGWKCMKSGTWSYSIFNKYEQSMVSISVSDGAKLSQSGLIKQEQYDDVIGFINYFNLQDKLEVKTAEKKKAFKI